MKMSSGLTPLKELNFITQATHCVTQSFSNDENRSYSVDHIDQKGRIWSASRTHGFSVFDPLLQQYEFKYYEPEDSEFGAYTLTVLEDTVDQQLIVSSDAGRGLFLYDLN